MGETNTCKNCGNNYQGKYCNNCGEKHYADKDKKLSHIIEEVFHFITHLDGTLLTSVRTMASAPGRLSLDYTAGIRKKYFKPVSLFLLLVILYLLFPVFSGLNMHFAAIFAKGSQYLWFAAPAAKWKMEQLHVTGDQLAVMYEHRSPSLAKIFLLLFLPLSALALRLVNYRRRLYYFDHFIFATEMVSVYLFFMFLFLPAAGALLKLIFPGMANVIRDGIWFLTFVFACILTYTVTAFRKFYGWNMGAALLRSVLFLIIFAVAVMYIYKTLLYLAVIISL